MLRLILSLGFACFLALANNPVRLFDETCIDSCPDDDAQGQCSADCADCVCCSHAPQSAASSCAVQLPLTKPNRVDVEWNERVLPLVEPREILDVPKAFLA